MPSAPRLARCLDLAQFPKNANKLTHVNTRATTPGSVYPLLYRDRRTSPKDMLDPTHAAAHIPVSERNKLSPVWHSRYFDLQALPKAWLVKDENPVAPRGWHYTPYPERRTKDMKGLDMSVVFSRRGDYMGEDKFAWSTVKRKLRTALQLIITRGARLQGPSAKGSAQAPLLAFDLADATADRWVQPDWTYVFLPKKELYRTTVNESVGPVREALAYILEQARLREKHKWVMPAKSAPKVGENTRHTRKSRVVYSATSK